MTSVEPNGEKEGMTSGFRCDLAGSNFDFASAGGAHFVACNCRRHQRKYEILPKSRFANLRFQSTLLRRELDHLRAAGWEIGAQVRLAEIDRRPLSVESAIVMNLTAA